MRLRLAQQALKAEEVAQLLERVRRVEVLRAQALLLHPESPPTQRRRFLVRHPGADRARSGTGGREVRGYGWTPPSQAVSVVIAIVIVIVIAIAIATVVVIVVVRELRKTGLIKQQTRTHTHILQLTQIGGRQNHGTKNPDTDLLKARKCQAYSTMSSYLSLHSTMHDSCSLCPPPLSS